MVVVVKRVVVIPDLMMLVAPDLMLLLIVPDLMMMMVVPDLMMMMVVLAVILMNLWAGMACIHMLDFVILVVSFLQLLFLPF